MHMMRVSLDLNIPMLSIKWYTVGPQLSLLLGFFFWGGCLEYFSRNIKPYNGKENLFHKMLIIFNISKLF